MSLVILLQDFVFFCLKNTPVPHLLHTSFMKMVLHTCAGAAVAHEFHETGVVHQCPYTQVWHSCVCAQQCHIHMCGTCVAHQWHSCATPENKALLWHTSVTFTCIWYHGQKKTGILWKISISFFFFFKNLCHYRHLCSPHMNIYFYIQSCSQ